MNIKHFIVTLILVASVMIQTSTTVNAEEVTCTVVYGQGEVCGVATEETVIEHAPVEAGLGDVSFSMLSKVAVIIALALFVLAKRTKQIYFLNR